LIATSLPLSAAAGALDRMEAAPKHWQGATFKPSYAFPVKPVSQAHPWDGISFRREPRRYMEALLAFALEGQDRRDWRLDRNSMRRWVHAPWMGPGATGREFIHGLTRERDLAPGELGSAQRRCRQNWAIAFYNPAGGHVLGKIWRPVRQGRAPDLSHLPFPAGTLVAKFVYTEATASEWPLLIGAPDLEANIHVRSNAAERDCPDAASAKRAPQKLRLIQVDLAVREPTTTYKTGWVFASFVYDGRKPGADPWAKLVPLGLMWGNDPFLSDTQGAAGEKANESIILTDLGLGPLGRGNRMNGLVDERSSACTSCHMAAQWPTAAQMTPPVDWAKAKCWFRNLDARYPFGLGPDATRRCGDLPTTSKMVALDFSLQLAIGLRNWSLAHTKDGVMRRTALGRLKRHADRLTVNEVPSVELRR
jgi:hypothetical protein